MAKWTTSRPIEWRATRRLLIFIGLRTIRLDCRLPTDGSARLWRPPTRRQASVRRRLEFNLFLSSSFSLILIDFSKKRGATFFFFGPLLSVYSISAFNFTWICIHLHNLICANRTGWHMNSLDRVDSSDVEREAQRANTFLLILSIKSSVLLVSFYLSSVDWFFNPLVSRPAQDETELFSIYRLKYVDRYPLRIDSFIIQLWCYIMDINWCRTSLTFIC